MEKSPSSATVRMPAADTPGEAPRIAEQRCQFIVLSGEREGQAQPIDSDREFRIGSDLDNELVLEDPTVSRHHCVVAREAGGWVLRDLKSTNGTFIDDSRIKEAYLRPGAVVRVGKAALRFASFLAPVSLPPSSQSKFGSVVGASRKMREIFAVLERGAKTDATILITGETGTGKGAIARALHEQSRRASEPFVVVDCGAVAAGLIESELFGHERGAFTGAEHRRAGAFEQVGRGTLFLDELDDLRKDLQSKLLRVLEERVFQRLGSGTTLPFEARVVGATKKSLKSLVNRGGFRDDLYFRLAVFQIELPPLRERPEDLPALLDRFTEGFGHRLVWEKLSPEVRAHLQSHHWPGNVRELRNVVERAFALSEGELPGTSAWIFEQGILGVGGDWDLGLPFKEAKERLIDRFERAYLTRLLARAGGNVTQAAKQAQVDRKYLYTLCRKHDFPVRGQDSTDELGETPGGAK